MPWFVIVGLDISIQFFCMANLGLLGFWLTWIIFTRLYKWASRSHFIISPTTLVGRFIGLCSVSSGISLGFFFLAFWDFWFAPIFFKNLNEVVNAFHLWTY